MKNSFFKLMVIPLFIFSICASAMKRPAASLDTDSDQEQLDWEHDNKRQRTDPLPTSNPCPGLFPELDDIPDFWQTQSSLQTSLLPPAAAASSVPFLASPEAASSTTQPRLLESPKPILRDEPAYWQQNRSFSPQQLTSPVPFPLQANFPAAAAAATPPRFLLESPKPISQDNQDTYLQSTRSRSPQQLVSPVPFMALPTTASSSSSSSHTPLTSAMFSAPRKTSTKLMFSQENDAADKMLNENPRLGPFIDECLNQHFFVDDIVKKWNKYPNTPITPLVVSARICANKAMSDAQIAPASSSSSSSHTPLTSAMFSAPRKTSTYLTPLQQEAAAIKTLNKNPQLTTFIDEHIKQKPLVSTIVSDCKKAFPDLTIDHFVVGARIREANRQKDRAQFAATSAAAAASSSSHAPPQLAKPKAPPYRSKKLTLAQRHDAATKMLNKNPELRAFINEQAKRPGIDIATIDRDWNNANPGLPIDEFIVLDCIMANATMNPTQAPAIPAVAAAASMIASHALLQSVNHLIVSERTQPNVTTHHAQPATAAAAYAQPTAASSTVVAIPVNNVAYKSIQPEIDAARKRLKENPRLSAFIYERRHLPDSTIEQDWNTANPDCPIDRLTVTMGLPSFR